MSTRDQIREARSDLTDYVIHLTRMVVVNEKGRTADWRFDRLKQIIKSGILRPTFGMCDTMHGCQPRTVKGAHKAVCFTEQPLEQILTTIWHLGGAKYMGYGIALHKADLFEYGGRHAMYGDDAMLEMLPNDWKFLWARYRPSRSDEASPVDFTCEREWRCRVATSLPPWGHTLPGVPLLLPQDFKAVAKRSLSKTWEFADTHVPDFRIIVRWDTDVQEVRAFINELSATSVNQAYFRVYYAALQKAQIISLEHIERKIEEDEDDAYRRIEDLPFPEDVVPKNPQKKVSRFLNPRS